MAKTNIDKLIDAAWTIFDERHSNSEGDMVITELLENNFHYDGGT